MSANQLVLWMFLTAACLSCGTVEPCGPGTCFGCCQADGQCVSGTAELACGSNGATCSACPQGFVCDANVGYVCAPRPVAPCGPSNCSGCCQNGQCQAGDTVLSCGRQGGACATCTPGQACDQGACHAVVTCTPESDVELCVAAGRACGTLAVKDRCGAQRTIASCGSCAAPKTCIAGQCSCTAETDAQLCATAGRACGTLTATDRCGAQRTIASCGSCAVPKTCIAGQCSCTPETDATFCTRLGRACGVASGNDNCGQARQVASCGTCAGTNTCNAGVCSCPAETNAAFCARLSAQCGAVSGTDLCGNPKSVASCGYCSGYHTCGGGGTPSVCGCTPQTESQLCAARSKNCGSLTLTDNCGQARTLNCGTCQSPQSCGGGGTANVCGCTAESNAAFCTRLSAQCGALTAADNCGTTRSVASCGTCQSPKVCTSANLCVCTPETDQALCARLGKNCGALSATDNCGASRTVASCGTCQGYQACGAGGVANVCGGRVEPMQPVCGGGYCWENPLPVGVNLWAAKTSPSGANWVVGENGTVLQWTGSAWRGWFAVTPNRLMAVWPIADNDVWAAGQNGAVVHFDGAGWTQVPSGTTQVLRGLWASGSGTVWAVGLAGTVLRRPAGGSFTVQTVPTTANLNAVYGFGNDVWAVGGTILHFDGASWSTTATSWELSDLWGSSATDLWAVSSQGVERFTGATWATSTAAKGTSVFGLSPTQVYVTSGNDAVYVFNGLSWSSKPIESTQGWVSSLYGLTGRAADGTLLAVGSAGALYRFDGGAWFRLNRGVSALTPQTNLSTGTVHASSTGVYVSGYISYPGWSFSGSGVVLACGNGPCTPMVTGTDAWPSRPSTSGAGDVWVVDTVRGYRGTGASWVSMPPLPSGTDGYGVAAVGPGDVWSVGRDATLHYDGAAFGAVPNPVSSTSTTLRVATTCSGCPVWAGGSGGTLLRYDGAAWSAVASGTTADIVDLRATGPQLALAAGSFGVLAWNGSAWSQTAQTAAVQSAWPESSTAFWVIEAGKAKRWSQGTVQDMTPWVSSLGLSLRDVAGSGTQVWLLGGAGELLRKQ